MNDKEKVKVEKANAVYIAALAAIDWCIKERVPWCIENPANSWLWELPPVKWLLSQPGVIDVTYDACMWGAAGPRTKDLGAP